MQSGDAKHAWGGVVSCFLPREIDSKHAGSSEGVILQYAGADRKATIYEELEAVVTRVVESDLILI